jgi:hypothetical protein
MLRKLSFAAAVCATMLALPVGDASAARYGGHFVGGRVGHVGVVRHAGVGWGWGARRWGWGVRRFGYVHRPFFRRRFFVGAAAWPWYGYSCWRWRPTYFGWRRVYVCGWPYYRYYRVGRRSRWCGRLARLITAEAQVRRPFRVSPRTNSGGLHLNQI